MVFSIVVDLCTNSDVGTMNLICLCKESTELAQIILEQKFRMTFALFNIEHFLSRQLSKVLALKSYQLLSLTIFTRSYFRTISSQLQVEILPKSVKGVKKCMLCFQELWVTHSQYRYISLFSVFSKIFEAIC